MINFLSSWIEQIILAIIITSIIEMILPNGNIKKYVKIVLSLFIIFNIISPFVNSTDLFNISEENLEKYTENIVKNNNRNKSSIDTRLEDLYIDELENNIKNKLIEYGYDVKKCEVDAILDSNNKNAGINKISLIISKNKNIIENVNAVEKIEIDNENCENNNTKNENEESNEIKELKAKLCEEYEIDENILDINVE